MIGNRGRRHPCPRLSLLLIVPPLLTAVGCGSKDPTRPPPPPAPTLESLLEFRVRRADSLQEAAYQNGRSGNLNSILEIVGGGVACLDYDLDGCCDLFLPRGGEIRPQERRVVGLPSALFRGDSRWGFADVSREAALAAPGLYTHGAVVGDYDNDGFPDLLVTGYRGVQLWRNLGDGTFVDGTAAADLNDAPWTTGAAWFDANDDGALDLYLASYVLWDFHSHKTCPASSGRPDVCSPNVFEDSPDAAYLSQNDGRFADISPWFPAPRPGKGLGVLAADLTGDRAVEVYVANDLTPNRLFQRNTQGRFQEIGFEAGVAADESGASNASMGVALLDFNLDRRFDLLVANFEHEDIALYQNDSPHLFRHVSGGVGLRSLGIGVVGFGLVAADFDCDGDEDAVLTSGHVYYSPSQGAMAQPPLVLENLAGRRFARREPACAYFARRHVGRGLAAGDLDDDGDLDLVVTHLDKPPVLLENTRRNDHSWLRVRLIGRQSSRLPIGATATVTVAGRAMVRQVAGGGSYLSQSQQELFWGWPGAHPASIRVEWPNGTVTELEHVAPRRRLTLREPRAAEGEDRPARKLLDTGGDGG